MRLPIIRNSPRSSATMASSTPRRSSICELGSSSAPARTITPGGLGFEHIVELAEPERHHHLVRDSPWRTVVRNAFSLRLRGEHGELRDISVEDVARAVEQQHDRRLELPSGKSVHRSDEELGGLVVVALAHPGAMGHEHGDGDDRQRHERVGGRQG